MKIGEVASLANVSVDAIRFYERRGVLPAATRRASGYREYTMATVERLRFVRSLRDMGFTLGEVVGLLRDVDRGSAVCATERWRFEAVLTRVDQKLAELRVVRRTLRTTLERCASGSCTLLERRARRSRGG
jgi:DNA-binding transcriptional MerR regulator